jgi:hypothetical protein
MESAAYPGAHAAPPAPLRPDFRFSNIFRMFLALF